jgi:hypothetical protein
MTTPDKLIVNALIQSYFNMRKGKWSPVGANGEINIPNDDVETAQKIDVCVKILQQADDCLYTQEWEDIIKLIYSLEQIETERHNKYWLPRRKFGSVLLIETLQAIRSYILQQLNTDNQVYKTLINSIVAKYDEALKKHTSYLAHPDMFSSEQIEAARVALDEADKNYRPYNLDELRRIKRDHLSFFANRIMINDPDSKDLKELSFSDFEKNVKHPEEQFRRKTEVCQKLLAFAKTHAQPSFAPASTSSVNNKSIVADSTKAAEKTKEVKFAAPYEPTVVTSTKTTTPASTTSSNTSTTSKSKSSHNNKHHNSKSSPLGGNSTFSKPAKPSNSSRTGSSNDNTDTWLNDLLEASTKQSHGYNTRSRNR